MKRKKLEDIMTVIGIIIIILALMVFVRFVINTGVFG